MPPRRWRRPLLLCFFLASLVQAQYSGGQFFTKGLAIISSPQPQAQFNAGSDLSIAISLSGQGNLTDFTPGSSDNSIGGGYDNLELFLISASNHLNLTVDIDFLTKEPGSNVKHPKFTIPVCAPAGDYNLTLYESSRFSSNSLFVITSVPLTVHNDKPSGQCSSNTVLGQPQVDAPLSGSPWILGKTSVSKLALSTATLASKDSQTFAAAPPPPPPSNQGNQSSSQQQEATSASTVVSASADSVIISTVPVTAASTQTTGFSSVFSSNIPNSVAGGSVMVQTITITTSVTGSTQASDLSDTGILFPINGAHPLAVSFRTVLLYLCAVTLLL